MIFFCKLHGNFFRGTVVKEDVDCLELTWELIGFFSGWLGMSMLDLFGMFS